MVAKKETLGFQAEVEQLLHLVTHALYSNKEIFLRELISNASDAADKLRFSALSNAKLYEGDIDLAVEIDIDQKAKTITISDNGIGMSRDEVVANLGTIAKSGTKEFLKSLTGDQAKDSQLIGQFGVGFYSAFIVADKVSVKTRKAGAKADQAVCWESDGSGKYTLETINKESRGTEITLHLKKDEKEFLEEQRIRNIVSKYSDHIGLPIKMKKPVELDDEGKPKKDQAVEYEAVNEAKALWTLPRKDISDEQYQEFYKHVSHDFSNPLAWSHNQVEGKLNYTSLLFVPERTPFDLWNRDQKHGLKLYVQRVFIMDEAEQFLPMYLRFIKGVIDSSDLNLNISREILQSNPTVDKIRSALVKRSLDMLTKMADNKAEDYAKFWNTFGKVLKEGVAEDTANKEKIAKLLRFASTKANSQQQNVSLADYIGRMQEGQEKIYYITADTFNAAKNSPHLEIFREKGIEVLLLSDPIDEWLIAHLIEFDGKQLQSVAKGGVDLGKVSDKEEEKQLEESNKEFDSTIKHVKEVLADKIKDVRITNRLTDSPACLVVEDDDMSRHMQRILAATGQQMPASQPIFELNPTHPLVQRLKAEQDDQRFAEWTNILFDQSLLAEGGQLDDPASFVHKLNKLLLELSN